MREAGERRVPRRADVRPAPSPAAGAWTALQPTHPGDDVVGVAHRHENLLRRVARRILGDDDQAQDAVQEAMLSLWQAAETPPSVRGWLLRTVVHRSLHARRTRDRRRRWENEAGEHLAEECPLCDPERQLHARRQLRAMVQALETLSEDYRAVLELREMEGLDYQEIAQRLAVPVGTVRSRLNRARRQLRARFDAPSSSGDALSKGAA